MDLLDSNIDSGLDSRPFGALERLWLKGEYSSCLRELGEIHEGDTASGLLAARCSYRLRDYARSLDVLQRIQHPHLPLDDLYLIDALGAACLTAQGDKIAAAQRLKRIADAPWQQLKPQTLCEVQQSQALCSWMSGDSQHAQAILDQIAETDDANQHARTLMLRSWSCGMRGEWQEQANLLVQAFLLLESHDSPDIGLLSNVGHALAALARERFVPKAFPALQRLVKRAPWTRDMDFERFQTLRLHAWALALQGGYLPAIHGMMAARRTVPSDRYEVLSHFDSSYLAMIAGESVTAQAEAAFAAELTLEIDWSNTKLEELAALIVGAEVLGLSSPDVADELLQIFHHHAVDVPRTFGMAHDGRLGGMEAYARAVIAYGKARPNDVRRYAASAYDVFAALEFDWRAARAAILLYRVGGGIKWLHAAQSKLKHYPNSFVSAEAQAIADVQSNFGDLTPRQSEVAARLGSGETLDEVASALRCSRNTVRVHAQKIYRTLGVSGQRELLVQQKNGTA